MKKRHISFMLTLTMVVSLFPMAVTVSAANTETYVPLEVSGFTHDVVVENEVGDNTLGDLATPFDGINAGANWALYEEGANRNGGI